MEHILFELPDGTSFYYLGKKYKKTSTNLKEIKDGRATLSIYVVPDLSYTKANNSNDGIYLSANIFVKTTKK